jgi:hypothetical protein
MESTGLRGQVIGVRIVSGFAAHELSAAIWRMKVEETRGGYDTPAFSEAVELLGIAASRLPSGVP